MDCKRCGLMRSFEFKLGSATSLRGSDDFCQKIELGSIKEAQARTEHEIIRLVPPLLTLSLFSPFENLVKFLSALMVKANPNQIIQFLYIISF